MSRLDKKNVYAIQEAINSLGRSREDLIERMIRLESKVVQMETVMHQQLQTIAVLQSKIRS